MKKKKQEKRSFRNVQDEFLTLLEAGLSTAGRVTKREFDRITDSVRDRLERKYGKEKLDSVTERIKNNWEDTVQKFQQARDRLEADQSFRKGKQIGVRILEDLAAAIKKAAENLEASLSDRVTYHAGQMVDKGVYLCVECRKIQEIKRRRKLVTCSECGSTEFRMA
jgi:Zinc-ribbon containing domain